MTGFKVTSQCLDLTTPEGQPQRPSGFRPCFCPTYELTLSSHPCPQPFPGLWGQLRGRWTLGPQRRQAGWSLALTYQPCGLARDLSLSARLSAQQWSWGNKGSLDGHVGEVRLVSRPGPGPEGGGYPLPILPPGSPPPQPPRDHPHRELPSTTLPPESRTWVDLGPCSGRRGPGGEPPTHVLPAPLPAPTLAAHGNPRAPQQLTARPLLPHSPSYTPRHRCPAAENGSTHSAAV